MKKNPSPGYSSIKKESAWRFMRVGAYGVLSNLLFLLPILQSLPKEYDTPLIILITDFLTAIDKYVRDTGIASKNVK